MYTRSLYSLCLHDSMVSLYNLLQQYPERIIIVDSLNEISVTMDTKLALVSI